MGTENKTLINSVGDEFQAVTPIESWEFVINEINHGGGMDVQEVLDLVKEKKLWLGGRGIMISLVEEVIGGRIEFDKNTGKYGPRPSQSTTPA